MRILHITPGSGDNFYCENCLRDKAVIRAIRSQGHDGMMVPLYLPPVDMNPGEGQTAPIFYGGVNVYLQQKFSLFRRTPRWMDKLFDAMPLLRWAGKKTGMTSPRILGETAISMLRGEQGRQVKELNRLVGFLQEQERPDVVVLSSILLVGLAHRIRKSLDVPIICMLQDEDEFLDDLLPEHLQRVIELMRKGSDDVAAFVSGSEYFAEEMAERIGLEKEKIHVIRNGLDVEDYCPASEPPAEPTIGFLSRMYPEKGLDILASAFVLLKQDERFRDLKLRAAGGHVDADEKYIEKIRQILADGGCNDDVELLGNLFGDQKTEYLRGLTVLSVPARRGEAAGTYVLESLACGVPVVQPSAGVFPELIGQTGGGLLFRPEDPASLAEKLAEMLEHPDRARQIGVEASRAVREKFDVRRQADELVNLYERVTQDDSKATD